MAQEKEMEKKENEKNTVTAEELFGDLTEAEEAEDQVEVAPAKEVKLPLAMDTVMHDGKTYHHYYVPVKIRDKDFKIEVRPKDGDWNAHQFLEIIFGESNRAELTCAVGTMMQEGTKKRTEYMVYTVVGYDEESGLPIEVGVKPYGDTSTRMLKNLYEQKLKLKF